jgi:hypothetical protein
MEAGLICFMGADLTCFIEAEQIIGRAPLER